MTLSAFIGRELQTSWLMISMGLMLTGITDLTYYYADSIGTF